MATGYTEAIKDDISFDDFVWRCARGMGALVMMRDEPHDAPIPEKFEPSDYYAKELAKAKHDMKLYQAMSVKDAAKEAREEFDTEVARRAESAEEDADLRRKYEEMLAKVQAWQPPSADHSEFRLFMESQIRESIKFDCGMGSYYKDNPVELLTGEMWLAQKISKTASSIERYTEEYEKEIQRTNGRNLWLKQLRESLNS